MKDTAKILEGRSIGNIPTLGRQRNDWDDRLDLHRMRKERRDKAREQIKKAGLGAILCYDWGNTRYLGALPYQTWAYPKGYQYVLLPRNGDPVLWTIGTRTRQIREELMTSWGGRVFGNHEVEWALIGGGDPDPFFKDIKKILSDHGVLNEPLGIDKPLYTVDLKEKFKEEGINLVDGMLPMLAAREVKTQDEIYCLNMAAAIAETAFEAIRANIRPGARECDVMAEGIRAAIQAGSGGIGDFNFVSGERTNRNMLNWTDKAIRPGELVFVDAANLSFLGYVTCYYRTFCCGKPTERQKEMYAECLEMMYNAIRLIKPGASTADVVKVWPTCDYWGCETDAEALECCICHGIGVSLHEAPVASRHTSLKNPLKFKEGNVCAIETWVGRDNPREGIRIEEEFVVTKEGAEIISKWPIDQITQCWI